MFNIFDLFYDLKIHKYIDVPACPRCGSNLTGIYVYNPGNFSTHSLLTEKNSLKKGQIIRTINIPIYEYGCNIFCSNCDESWYGPYKIKYISKRELDIINEKKDVDIDEINEKYKVDKKLKKKKTSSSGPGVKNLILPMVPFGKEMDNYLNNRKRSKSSINDEDDYEYDDDNDYYDNDDEEDED